MKTLIHGAGPIGQWLALRLSLSGADAKRRRAARKRPSGQMVIDRKEVA